MSKLSAQVNRPRKHRGRGLLVPVAAGLTGLVIGSASAAEGERLPTPAVTITETVTAPPVTEAAAAPAPVTETVTESATATVTRSAAASVPESEVEADVGAYLGGGRAASYANCDAVRAAGAAPITRGDSGFEPKFDRDGDGVGCK